MRKNIVSHTGIFLTLLPVCVIIGKAVDSDVLSLSFLGYPPMITRSAFSLFFFGIAIVLDFSHRKKTAYAIVSAIFLLNLIQLLGYYLWEEPAEYVLLGQDIAQRPPAITLFTMLLLTGGFILQSHKQCRAVGQVIMHLVSVLTLAVLTGYVLEIADLTSFTLKSSMAFSTAGSLFLASSLLTFRTPEEGLTGLFRGKEIGSIAARKIFPQLVIAVLITIVLWIELYQMNLINAELGMALLGLGAIVSGTTIIWINARSLNLLDKRRSFAQKQLQKLNSELELLIARRTSEINAILNVSNVAIISTDHKGIIKSFSDGASEMLGYTAKETIGRMSLFDFIDNRIVPEGNVLRKMFNQTEPDQSAISNLACVSKAGKKFSVQVTVSSILNNEREVIGYVAIAQDISGLIEKESELRKLAKDLELKNARLLEFAHITSHDLRSPARNLDTLLKLEDQCDSQEEKEFFHEKTKVVSKHLNTVLEELINLLQTEDSEPKDIAIIPFQEVFQKVEDMLAADIISSGAKISTDFSELREINFSAVYLESIFANLLSNSIKYRSPERACEISLKSGIINDKKGLTIRDNGIGIDMTLNGNKVFGLRKTFHTNQDAKGVGLYLVKSHIESLGGSIEISSKPGEGTEFRIYFR